MVDEQLCDLRFKTPFNNTFHNAFENGELPIKDGTYEAIGPHFNGNKHNLGSDILVKHGTNILDVPRTFEGIKQYLQVTPTEIVRDCMADIDWNAPILSIRGPKGVGKSTLIKQYIRMHFAADDRSVLYCSLDGIYFSSHTLIELAGQFYKLGGKHLFLDEVHKYPNWSNWKL